eukprot:CAMPEP_0206449096 /NCGR_PEP_ID=MMETSP0324_2-20121206/17884_1 /ASSEMBLY_ACC=CAM_ASM_000836 /TAXON_ID=2866 /ORGANISM="Crypthecodinium cohnii, Strain Seligo" /LENGTH=380 /DNA_ID=CAMNT_0053918405 /DNA_START=92 /DNA_END=1234 /DNA_ORIENTATION=-
MVPGDLDRNFDFVLGERQSNTYKARKAVAPAGKGRLYRQQRTPKDATFKNRRPRLPTEAIRMRIPDTDELEEAFDALRKLEGGSLASVPQAQVNLSYCDSRRDWRNLQDIVEKRYGRQIREELGGATELLPVHPEEEVQRHFLQTCSRNPHALSIGYHGTKSKNYEGIARRGLLVPSAKKKGPGSGVRVTNGSAHGVGVYTATFGHADLSRGFSDTGAVFVCAICDTSYLNQFEPDAEVTDPIRVSTKTLANTQKKGLDVHRASSQVLHVGDAMVIYDQHFVVPLFLAKPAELLGEVGFKAWEAPHQIGRRRIVVPKEGDPGVIYGNARERRGEAVWIPVLPLEGFTGKLKTVRRRFERRWREKGLKYRDDKYLNWDYLC